MNETQADEIRKHFSRGHDLAIRACGRMRRKNANAVEIFCRTCGESLYTIDFLSNLTQTQKRWYQEQADETYTDEGSIEVDDGARLSPSDEGSYVQAWVWVPKPDMETVMRVICGKFALCNAHRDALTWDNCSDTFEGKCQVKEARKYMEQLQRIMEHDEGCPNCDNQGRDTCPLCSGTNRPFPEE